MIFPLNKKILIASNNPTILRWRERLQNNKNVLVENQNLQVRIKMLEVALETKRNVFLLLFDAIITFDNSLSQP